ncbi:DUF4328 domain-containing protein [Streptomyces rimosus]|uniref:DUF4328 domain-containing protein n=1 Tax=Streptomyces rimosus TaxID=1927 RepID=UPI00067B864E|nr:DUF4328 domain-containing protein [Streptomyces rimosus]
MLLCTAIAAGLFALGTDVNLVSLLGNLEVATEQEALRADALMTLAGNLQGCALFATGVVFIIWFHRSRVNAEHYTRDVCTLGRGWAIGSWFIPIGNLGLPFRVAKETWQASAQSAPHGSWRTVSTAPVRAWWAVWILGAGLGNVGYALALATDTPETARLGMTAVAVADLLDITAAVLAILFVRKLTRMQQTAAAPYTAPRPSPQP